MTFKRKMLTVFAVAMCIGAVFAAMPQHASAQGGAPYKALLPAVMRPPGPPANPVHRGYATWYLATGSGTCSFDASPDDLMVTAVNSTDFNGSNLCGAFLRVTGPRGVVTVRVVDLCPNCAVGGLDMSGESFARIANLTEGRVPITWQVVSPEIEGPIAYHFNPDASRWWTAVQVRNHRNPIATFEYRLADGTWVLVPRSPYNYFAQQNPGMGRSPYAFRITDIYGNSLMDEPIALAPGETIQGHGQFPVGP